MPQRDGPSVGLAATADESSFKCYMGDTGLLVSHLFADNGETPHEVYRDILLGKLEINEGMFTENAVAQQLVCSGRGLYFYSRRDDRDWSNTMEVDFLVTRGYDDAAGRMRVSPVEVKSTKRYGARSLDKFKDKFGSRVGTRYILHPRPMGGLRRPGEGCRSTPPWRCRPGLAPLAPATTCGRAWSRAAPRRARVHTGQRREKSPTCRSS